MLNTAANRRWTFGVAGRDRLARHHFEGLGVFALGLALTSGALGLLHLVGRRPNRSTEVAALLVANAASTALRFVLLRGWASTRGAGWWRRSIPLPRAPAPRQRSLR